MAAVSGKQGVVMWEGNAIGLTNFNLDVNTDQLDTTEFSTDTLQWRTFANGLATWTGTCDGPWRAVDSTERRDFQTAALAGTTGTITFEVDKTNGGKFAGGCNISAMGISAGIDVLSQASFSLQGNGSVAFTTTT